ncbi:MULTISPECIES: fumarylacetoacetate hydrolase family protein [Streptomyces]|uniref:fumarylacetoacetate hydrolase family protein n=1 Tax=Streptomyces lycopersici TaxID=2974589 RepID=UPI0021CDF70A|nr:fumarylacetoacetate hydrolase family protein [Streptomyces sp. NEAU-383]
MSVWSLVTCRPDADGAASFVAVADTEGQIRHHPALARYPDIGAVLRDWADLEPALRSWQPTEAEPLEGVRVLAPVPAPGKLVFAGANYRDHLREMGVEDVPDDMEPYFFLLPPTAIVGPNDPIAIPDNPGARVDWEAELGVVIGRRVHDVPVESALEAVAGYTIINDISARGLHARPNPLAPPFAYDWLASKGRDTFAPIGPGVTPSWLVPDPQSLPVRLWRNGVLEQDGNTKNMIFGVAQLISAASKLMTLEPGDVLATGTPAGVGVAKGIALEAGDRLRIEIEPLGALANDVRLTAHTATQTALNTQEQA